MARLSLPALYALPFALAALALPAAAQESGGISLQLSNSYPAPDNGDCIVGFTFQNDTGARITEAAYQLVALRPTGAVADYLSFSVSDVPSPKRRFPLARVDGHSCEEIAELVVDTSTSCMIEAAEADTCNEALTVSSALETLKLGE